MNSSDSPSALVIGESLIDRISDGSSTSDHPGGSPFNVAVTLGRLGDRVRLLTAIGRDHDGLLIEAALRSSGVELESASHHSGTSSSAHAHLKPDGSADYDFDISWTLSSDAAPPPTAVTHAGSISVFLEPGASEVARLLDARAGATLITLDPNIRPSLLGDRPAAVTRFEALLPRVDILKLSDEDAEWLYPGRTGADIVSELLGRGPRLVALTRGSEGSLLGSAHHRVTVPSAPTTVVDTIGAGDSFMGALIHLAIAEPLGSQLRAGADLDAERLTEIGRFASTVAAMTVARPGANPPTLAEVEARIAAHD